MARIGYNPEKLRVSSRQLEPRQHESECVRSLSYDPEREQMTVEFHKRGTYTYFGVEPWAFAEFNGAGSRGTYFNLYVRDKYEYERIA